jgi:predicted RNA binding protein YcfA (HicA-like mRNA interferase family)
VCNEVHTNRLLVSTAEGWGRAIKPPALPKRGGMTKVERNSRKIIKRLESEGWEFVKAEGSHHKFIHRSMKYPVIVPHPKKDLPHGTARAIARAAGWLDK